MNESLSLLTAFLLGFMGSAHCLGMCGGIVSLLSINNPNSNPIANNLAYQVGRISTYALLGFGAGYLGLLASESHSQAILALRTLSGILLILMGFYLMGFTRSLVWLESAGSNLWKYIQPVSKHILPATNLKKAILLGMIWGFLPCGLIYTTLTWSAASADPLEAATLMAFFGLGNLPALFSAGLFAQQINKLRQNPFAKYVFGLSIVGFGLWTFSAIW